MPSIVKNEMAFHVRKLAKDEGLPFRPLLSGQMLERVFDKYNVNFRDRTFPPDLTLTAFCSQLISFDHSCRGAVTRVNSERTRQGLAKCSASTSAYCQARARLPFELIRDLGRSVAHELESNHPRDWLWKGRSVKLLDGSTLSMPDTKENQTEWPQHKAQGEGLGFPIMRVVSLMSLATGAVIDFAFGPCRGKDSGELTLAKQLLPSLTRNDIILADRYYCSYFFIATLLALKVDIITRLRGERKSGLRSAIYAKSGDHLLELIKPPRPVWMDESTYEKMPKILKLREIKSGHKDDKGQEVVLVTTLLDPDSYTRTELLACSKRRWNVELDLRSMKTIMGMDVLACKTPEMIKKEVWTYILTYNLVRQLISRAAIKYKLEPRQISFTGAIQVFLAFAPLFDGNPNPHDAKRYYDTMLEMIASYRIGNRPGRREPKVVKRRPKRLKKMTRPRHSTKTSENAEP
jgi:hypothetical protein